MFDEKDFLRELSRDPVRETAVAEFLKQAKLEHGKGKCDHCGAPMTKKILWCEGKAYVPSCDEHVATVTKKHEHLFDYGGPDGIKQAAAGPREAAKALGKLLKAKKNDIAAAGGGAALATAAQYKANKSGKQRDAAQRMVEATKDPKSFSGEVAHITAKTTKDLTDTSKKYPGRAALMAAPVGAMGGKTLLNLMRKFKKGLT